MSVRAPARHTTVSVRRSPGAPELSGQARAAKSYSCWITRRGCTLAWNPNQASPVGAGGKRRHPRAHENTGIGADEQKLDELLTQGVGDGDARAALLKLAVRKIVEEALEAEVTEAVGREYYETGAAPGGGYRNGYRRGRLRTAEGPIEYGVPQVADRTEPFVSRVRAGLAGRTTELERLAVEIMFAVTRGGAGLSPGIMSRACGFRTIVSSQIGPS